MWDFFPTKCRKSAKNGEFYRTKRQKSGNKSSPAHYRKHKAPPMI